MEQKPFTDTPWHSDGRMILSEPGDSIVAMVATGAEDRDFIITACNAHAGLVEALREVHAMMGHGMATSLVGQKVRNALAAAGAK